MGKLGVFVLKKPYTVKLKSRSISLQTFDSMYAKADGEVVHVTLSRGMKNLDEFDLPQEQYMALIDDMYEQKVL